ncbi:hypothetical protein [Microbacterium gorillae]|uniref:hypothetical protein n=1 Tax=Microbacterium gorillae TaxID=1231063 RepID=UPI003D996BED
MSGRDAADSAELSRLQRAVYGPDAGADIEVAQGHLLQLQASQPAEREPLWRGEAEPPGPPAVSAPPRRGDGAGMVARALFASRPGSPTERLLWGGLGALAVVVLTIGGFFLGALIAPHPDRVLIPVVQADHGVVGSEDVSDYREFVAGRFKIGIGTVTYGGPGLLRCLYVGGPSADLRSESLSGACSPASAYGTTWEMQGDLGTGSSLFGLGVRDSVRFIERDSGLEVWLSGKPT